MSLASALASRNTLVAEIGKDALNMKYPKEFELYIIALELTDADFNTIKYFIFPVNPSSLEESEPQITNTKVTLGGVTSLKKSTFIPTDITLSGNFGRGFKALIGSSYQDLTHAFQVSDVNENGETTNNTINGTQKQLVFDDRIKTGYGCIKVLEDIVKESVKKNRRLIFHNPALGNSYLVNAGTLRLHMTEQTNMIWSYSLPLKSTARIESLNNKQQMDSIAKQLTVTNFFQKRVNMFLNTASKLLGDAVNRIPK